MTFSLSVLFSPFSWYFFSAVAFGAALSHATRGTRRQTDRQRAINRKWTLVSIYLSGAVILATCGVFIPGPEKVRDITILYLFVATLAVSFLAFRFKRAIGLPFALTIIFAIIIALLFFRSLKAFTGETEIARVRVLSSTSETMKLEVMLIGLDAEEKSSEETFIISLTGQYFAPIVKVIIFDDLYVFLGTKTWYRLVGLTSFGLEKSKDGFRFRQSDTDYYFEQSEGIQEWVYEMFERYENDIPGVKSVQVEIDLKKVQETVAASENDLQAFSVRVQNDGGVQIVRIN